MGYVCLEVTVAQAEIAADDRLSIRVSANRARQERMQVGRSGIEAANNAVIEMPFEPSRRHLSAQPHHQPPLVDRQQVRLIFCD
jgi:hypothetical protein